MKAGSTSAYRIGFIVMPAETSRMAVIAAAYMRLYFKDLQAVSTCDTLSRSKALRSKSGFCLWLLRALTGAAFVRLAATDGIRLNNNLAYATIAGRREAEVCPTRCQAIKPHKFGQTIRYKQTCITQRRDSVSRERQYTVNGYQSQYCSHMQAECGRGCQACSDVLKRCCGVIWRASASSPGVFRSISKTREMTSHEKRAAMASDRCRAMPL